MSAAEKWVDDSIGKTGESVPVSRLDKIAEALAKAQIEMQNPGFDSTNPHFRNRFASLAAVRNAVVPVLAKNGIFVAQDISSVEGGVSCITILTHSSGQQMRFGPLVLPVSKNDAQGFGSAATYCRRYSLMAVACVVGDDDDDANAATGKPGAAEIHSPKGDLGKTVLPSVAREEAGKVRAVLALDVEHRIKALKAFDLHEVLNRDPDLYTAVGDELTAKERADFKAYVKEAKELEKEDRAVSNVGKRF